MLYFSRHSTVDMQNITFCRSTVQEFMSTVLHITMADDSTVNRIFPMAISFTLFSFTHEFCLLSEASSQCCVHVIHERLKRQSRPSFSLRHYQNDMQPRSIHARFSISIPNPLHHIIQNFFTLLDGEVVVAVNKGNFLS